MPLQAKEDLLKVLSAFKGAKVVKDEGSYIYCEFEREFGFVDDVEFLFAPDGQAGIPRAPSASSKAALFPRSCESSCAARARGTRRGAGG